MKMVIKQQLTSMPTFYTYLVQFIVNEVLHVLKLSGLLLNLDCQRIKTNTWLF